MAKPDGSILIEGPKVLKALGKRGKTVAELLVKLGVVTTSGPPKLGKILVEMEKAGVVGSRTRPGGGRGRPPKEYFLVEQAAAQAAPSAVGAAAPVV